MHLIIPVNGTQMKLMILEGNVYPSLHNLKTVAIRIG